MKGLNFRICRNNKGFRKKLSRVTGLIQRILVSEFYYFCMTKSQAGNSEYLT
jgi:hypothetical protein